MSTELERLREFVSKRRGAVTSKIARIRRNTGVELKDTRDDPRRDPKVVKNYNTRQLKTYLSQLELFQSRGVGFVALSGGVPAPRNKFALYKKYEKQYNALGERHLANVADTFIPLSGMTIAQRNAMIHPHAQGEVVNRPYIQINREPKNIASVEALDALIKDMKAKLSKSYLPKEIKKARSQLEEMFNTMGMGNFAKQARALTDSQFDTLWNYTNFATNVSIPYELLKMRAAGSKEQWYDSVIEDSTDDIRELFDWAEKLPEGGK